MKSEIFEDLEMLPFCGIKLSLGFYQDNWRIYMDEFPTVEEWDFVSHFDTTFISKRFLEKN